MDHMSAPGTRFSEEDEARHVAEAWRRARLAGRTGSLKGIALGAYDFPPCVGHALAAVWITKDVARRRCAEAQQLEARQDRFAVSALPLSVCGDMTVVMGLWALP